MTMEGRISFISQEGQIEESAGRRKFFLICEKAIPEFERRMLCGSHCPHILPMFFLTEGDTDTVHYDFTGCLQVRDYIKSTSCTGRETQKKISDALDLLAGVLEGIKGMENYLIFPDRISIHTDTIFVHLDTGHVLFAYYPNEQPELTLKSRIIQISEDLIEITPFEETKQHLRKYIELIALKNPGLDGMISMLGAIRREVSYIYWNAQDLRRAETAEPRLLDESAAADKKNLNWKRLAIHCFFIAGLLAVFLSGRMGLSSFAGLVILAAAADLLIIKKLPL